MPSDRKVLEKNFKDAVLAALTRDRGTMAWVQNAGLAFGAGGGRLTLMPDGSADVGAAVAYRGVAAWVQVECKMPGRKQRESQRRWAKRVREVGGVYVLAVYDEALDVAANAEKVRDAVLAELEARHERWLREDEEAFEGALAAAQPEPRLVGRVVAVGGNET